jgi:hypothetical protein
MIGGRIYQVRVDTDNSVVIFGSFSGYDHAAG